jgi:hypothetical protein
MSQKYKVKVFLDVTSDSIDEDGLREDVKLAMERAIDEDDAGDAEIDFTAIEDEEGDF